ncbi:MAG TPA: aminodeoxychorismate synthase component I [Candidatus Limnocylindrales bacterium]|nr:aminodeoxychorismate synthase component I [Candidatus Limnocylindrales bacterium]
MQPLIERLPFFLHGPDVFEALDNGNTACYLDSGIAHENLSRYSFVGVDPFMRFSTSGTSCCISERGGKTRYVKGSPFAELARLVESYSGNGPSPFPLSTGGAVGYFSYDLGRLLERLPNRTEDDLLLPECNFAFFDGGVVLDHIAGCAYLVSTGLPFTGEAGRRHAGEKMSHWRSLLEANAFKTAASTERQERRRGNHLQSNFTKDAYCRSVEQALEYIAAGDIYQVNLSQRFTAQLETEPWELYRRLRYLNPAPFASFLRFPEVTIACSSPERFLLVEGDRVETRPIKGTRPRGHTPKEDAALREELATSEKDRAELVMIVDLERNDLGRVCQTGSVEVTELFCLETYATVYHLVSTVTGRLPSSKNVFDLLPNVFPGGSITGAPKIRAMEIIEELEPVRRNIYTGSLGYIDFAGRADLNIVIRTFVIKGNRVYFQVGGGIVADSQPEMEYQETLHKARALLGALGVMEGS